jgi:hypothetical protein
VGARVILDRLLSYPKEVVASEICDCYLAGLWGCSFPSTITARNTAFGEREVNAL